MQWGNVAELVGAGASLATAILAAWIGLSTFKQQRTSVDVQLALSVFETINRYWDRIADHTRSDARYDTTHDMGQILCQFELAASMFNRRTLSRDALLLLKNHIVDVFTDLRSTDQGRRIIASLHSSDQTFVELRAFVDEHVPASPLDGAESDEPQPPARRRLGKLWRGLASRLKQALPLPSLQFRRGS